MPCERCPHAQANLSPCLPEGDTAEIMFGEDDSIRILYDLAEPGVSEMHTIYPPEARRLYPELLERLDNCQKPLMLRRRRQGWLGRLGLSEKVPVCPALDFDPHSSHSVVRYFEPSLFSE